MVREEVKKIGQTLKQRREELAMSLKEVENATSIRLNFLLAIEEGDMGKLISPVYAQGFIKQYGLFLGLDPDRLVKEHPEVFHRSTKPRQDFSYGIGTLEARGTPGSGIKGSPNTLYIVAFCLILTAAYYFARYLEVI